MTATEKKELVSLRSEITATAQNIIDNSTIEGSKAWAEIVKDRMRGASLQSCKKYKESLVKHLNKLSIPTKRTVKIIHRNAKKYVPKYCRNQKKQYICITITANKRLF